MRFESRLNVQLFAALVAGFLLAGSFASPAQPPARRIRPAGELIQGQSNPIVVPRVMEKITPSNVHVLISLSRQRAYLMAGDEIAIDTPISSGKSAGMTSTGSFTVSEKDADHRSSVYGDFVDGNGRVVRAGVSLKIDSAPSGTHYVGAPMRWFMRFNGAIGMHVGILPGYPASHGCVRLPSDIARLIYNKVNVGTPVEVTN